MSILRVRDPSLGIFFNDLRVHVYCLFLWELFLKKWVRLWKIEKKNLRHRCPFAEMCPNVIHVCTPDRREDQREGLVGTAPPPLFVTNNPANLVVPIETVVN